MTTTDEQRLYSLGDTDYAVPPGETLRELLEEQGLTQRDLARRADLTPKHVNKLLQGMVPLSADVAMRLERVTGTPARIWNRLEADYRSDLQRLRSQRDLSADVMWTMDFPVAELVKREILPAEPSDKVGRLEQVLAFFGVASPSAWRDVYADLTCAFRTSKTFETKPGALAAWLRLGEIAARDVYCEPFNRKKLEEALPTFRELTKEGADTFVDRVRDLCASCGVAVVFVRELSGTRASGVTRWLTPTKALIQLSLRYKTDDHLWFTFFHEIGHVLKHGKTDVWIEATSRAVDDPKEAEADRFSRDMLIPPRAAAELPRLKTEESVRRFAQRIGVSPGVVVGRLQHDELWAHSRGNRLKRPLGFTESGDVE
ncbi:MAG: helix-turn-helix domain-containing protein [Nocardiopsaceae bacterium]|nr:helix-turn-helix domain-containing protein [Nocardiopsaceae bacterium]